MGFYINIYFKHCAYGDDKMTEKTNHEELLVLTSEIVSSYVANNTLGAHEITPVIEQVYKSLSGLGAPPLLLLIDLSLPFRSKNPCSPTILSVWKTVKS